MPTNLKKLLADVVAHPDNAKARQVYADALEEAGDPRGQFMQLQTQADAATGDAKAKLEKAAAKLEKVHRRKWIAELPMIRQATFRHGLVDTVVATADPFVAGADALFAAAPVRGLKLTKFNAKKHLPKLAEVLAKWPLRALDLESCKLGPDHIQALFAKANVSQLESLRLIHDPIGDAGARFLAQLPFRKLHTLELGGSDAQQPGAEAGAVVAFTQSPAFHQLRLLNLWAFGVDANGHAAIAQSPIAKHLTELNLQSNHGGDEGLIALAASPYFRELRSLNLGHCQATDKGVRALLDAPWLTGLRARTGPNPWTLLLWQVRASAATKKAFANKLGEGAVVW